MTDIFNFLESIRENQSIVEWLKNRVIVSWTYNSTMSKIRVAFNNDLL